MASYKIQLRIPGTEGKELEVRRDTTVGEIKRAEGLKGYLFYFKKPVKDAQTMQDIAIEAGDTISAYKTGQSLAKQQSYRLKNGQHTVRVKYGQASSSTEGVVMEESNWVANKVEESATKTGVIN